MPDPGYRNFPPHVFAFAPLNRRICTRRDPGSKRPPPLRPLIQRVEGRLRRGAHCKTSERDNAKRGLSHREASPVPGHRITSLAQQWVDLATSLSHASAEALVLFALPKLLQLRLHSAHIRWPLGWPIRFIARLIEPGSPWENGYVESFNGKLGTSCWIGKSSAHLWRRKY